MGAALCGSSAVSSYTDVQIKELKSAKQVFDLIGIQWNGKKATKLHSFFDHGVDNSEGLANVTRLCKALRLPREHFYTQSFVIFGNQSKSMQGIAPVNKWQMAAKASIERCTMSQYVVGIWNLCTLSLPHGMAIWMYRLHFGNDGAHPANIMELMDKRYGISEEADYRSNIDKRWYGKDYHKNNVIRTKALIAKYTNKETKRVDPAGWLELIKRSPGLLQNHIAARKDLRERILGERFWRKMDKLKKSKEELKNIDQFVRAIEQENPGILVTPAGREFFNVDHYNFGPVPPQIDEEDEELSAKLEAIERQVKQNLYGNEDMEVEQEDRLFPKGQGAAQSVQTASVPEQVPEQVPEEMLTPIKKPRADAAARAERSAKYKFQKSQRVTVERGKGKQ